MRIVPTLCASALTAACLAGCAVPYAPPAEGDTARLRIAVPQTGRFASTYVDVMSYPTGKCEAPMALGMVGGVGHMVEERPAGVPGEEFHAPRTAIERVIPAGSTYLLSLRGFFRNDFKRYVCTITLSFVPEKGMSYEARYRWTPDNCQVGPLPGHLSRHRRPRLRVDGRRGAERQAVLQGLPLNGLAPPRSTPPRPAAPGGSGPGGILVAADAPRAPARDGTRDDNRSPDDGAAGDRSLPRGLAVRVPVDLRAPARRAGHPARCASSTSAPPRCPACRPRT